MKYMYIYKTLFDLYIRTLDNTYLTYLLLHHFTMQRYNLTVFLWFLLTFDWNQQEWQVKWTETWNGKIENGICETQPISEFQDDFKRWTYADDKIGVPLSAGSLGSICGSSNKHMNTIVFFM